MTFKNGDKVIVAPSSRQYTQYGAYGVGTVGATAGNQVLVVYPGGVKNVFEQEELTSAEDQLGAFAPQTVTSPAKKVAPKDMPKPTVSLSTVVLAEEKIEEIRAAIAQQELAPKIFGDWGFGEVFEKGTAVSLLFHGIPGTGKTLTAQAIADDLGMDLKVITTAELESSVPGEFERRVQKFFQDAAELMKKAVGGKVRNGKVRKQILLFDECDSLLASRDRVGVIMGAQINSLLTAIEHFDGIVIFTTNRIGELDPALERRIAAKIEFPFPSRKEREAIWRRLIPAKAPISKKVNFAKLAEFPMAGGNIKNCVLNAARMAAYKKKEEIDYECFINAIEREMQSSQEFTAAIEQAERRKYGTRGGMGLPSDVGKSENGGLELESTEKVKRLTRKKK